MKHNMHPEWMAPYAPGELKAVTRILTRLPLAIAIAALTAFQSPAPAQDLLQNGALEGEVRKGPVAIQGDHGPIAIRSLRDTPLDNGDQTRISALTQRSSRRGRRPCHRPARA